MNWYKTAASAGPMTFDYLYRMETNSGTPYPFWADDMRMAANYGEYWLVAMNTSFQNMLTVSNKAEAAQFLMANDGYTGKAARPGEYTPEAKAILDNDRAIGAKALQMGYDAIYYKSLYELQVLDQSKLQPFKAIINEREELVNEATGAPI